ncbi:MAG: sensor histidine kinase [Candidatus Saccharimonadales bacterium]
MHSAKEYELTIAKLKRKLSEAHINNAKTNALFASIGEGLMATDEYGRIEQVNNACTRILGYTKDELVGKRFMDMIKAVNEDGSLIDPIDRPITRTFMNGTPISGRTYYLTKYSTAVPVDINVSPLMINGVPSGAIEVFRDLTDEYTKEKIQSEFISLASHQLRTPLSSIYTYAQMLTEGYAGKMNSRQANFVSVIEHSAMRMNELVHALLNVTRLEAGNITVEVEPVDISDICSEVIATLSSVAEAKQIDVQLISDYNNQIMTDPILLRELLNNLLSNALKYTPPKGEIIVGVEFKDRVTIYVKDNGFGIPETSKDHIFSKFYRAKNAVKYDVSGTGLGLYLAKQIAERLEGDIWFISEVGKGSTFYFSLPTIGSAKKSGQFRLEVA